MANARPRARKQPNLISVQLDAVSMPNILPHPADARRIIARTHPKPFAAKSDIPVIFSQMRMQAHVISPRQTGRFAHQINARAKRRTRRHRNSQHRPRPRIMPAFDKAPRIPKNIILALDQRVRGQAALTFAQAHRAARGMKTQTHLRRRPNLILKPNIIREKIKMIAGRRAARQHEFSHRQLGRNINMLAPQPRPNRIQGLQPAKQALVLRQNARQALEHVMMRVDQARQNSMIGQIKHAVSRRHRLQRAQRRDKAVLNIKRRAGKLPPPLIHGRQAVNVLEQQRRHHAGDSTAIQAALTVFCSSMAIVIGPTPPGTCVIQPATARADSKSTSPT